MISLQASKTCMYMHVFLIYIYFTGQVFKLFVLSQNLNGLLVTRQIDNTSPGGALGKKFVPGSLVQEMQTLTQ